MHGASGEVLGKQYIVPIETREKLWFMLFALLWSLNFIFAVGQLMIATAVAKFYYTPEDKKVV